jgi:hypothetical protein
MYTRIHYSRTVISYERSHVNSIPGTPGYSREYGDACFIRSCSSSSWDELGQHYSFGIVLPEWEWATSRYMVIFPCNKGKLVKGEERKRGGGLQLEFQIVC